MTETESTSAITTPETKPLSKKEKKIAEMSHKMDGEYAVLMETNESESESWYYFILAENNMENLQHLQDQLEKVEWFCMRDLSMFDLDLEHLVSAKTAKEMTKLELNSYSFHRKFDGILSKVDLGFKRKDRTEKMMCRAFDILGYGQIEDFINDEDIDPEDLLSDMESDSDNGSESDSTSDDSDSGSESHKSESHKSDVKEPRGVPAALLNCDRPGWAKAKGKKKHHR